MSTPKKPPTERAVQKRAMQKMQKQRERLTGRAPTPKKGKC
jgi:hypothetical protein